MPLSWEPFRAQAGRRGLWLATFSFSVLDGTEGKVLHRWRTPCEREAEHGEGLLSALKPSTCVDVLEHFHLGKTLLSCSLRERLGEVFSGTTLDDVLPTLDTLEHRTSS